MTSQSPDPGRPAPGLSERFTVAGEQLVDKVKDLIHEGNVSHIKIKHEGHTVIEIPVTVGVIGAVLAPVAAAVAAVGAILAHCTVEVTRSTPAPPGGSP